MELFRFLSQKDMAIPDRQNIRCENCDLLICDLYISDLLCGRKSKVTADSFTGFLLRLR